MGYAADVKAKAKEIRKAATKYRAKEVDRERQTTSDDPYDGQAPPTENENGAPIPPGGPQRIGYEVLPIVEGDDDWKYIYDAYEWIEEVWQPWADDVEDPDKTVPIVNALSKVAGKAEVSDKKGATVDSVAKNPGGALGNSALDNADETFSLVESSWEGAGADAFMDFIANVVPAQRNQVALGKSLLGVAVANHDMLESIRKTVKDVQKDSLAAIEAQGPGGLDWAGIQTALTIGGVAAAFVSGVGALPAVAAIGASSFGRGDDEAGERRFDSAKAQISIFSAATLLRAFMPTGEKKAPKPKLGADTVDGVLDNMAGALVDMYDHREKAEDSIIKMCTENLEFIRDFDKNGVPDIDNSKPIVVAPRPKAMVDGSPDDIRDGFRPDGSQVPASQR